LSGKQRVYVPNELCCIIIPFLQTQQNVESVVEDSAKFVKLDVLKEYFTQHELDTTDNLLKSIPYERISPCLNKYSTITTSVDELISKDEALGKAVEEADQISNALRGKIVVTKFNNLPYAVEYVDFMLTPQSIMDSSTKKTYSEYYLEKYSKNIADKNQPLIRGDFINVMHFWKDRWYVKQK
jgi:hypothetical protein